MADNEQIDEQAGGSARRLRLFLRLVGTADLLAVAVVFFPGEWLARGHELTGLGIMPQDPIAGYLARSTSLLYGVHGAILLVLASNVLRYVSVIRWYGRIITVAGLLLTGIDLAESMPLWWTVFEGAAVVGIGLVILTLCHNIPELEDSSKTHQDP